MQVSDENMSENLEKYYRYGEDWLTRYLHRQRVDHLAEVIGKLSEGTTALDVGCGGGVYTVLLAAENPLTVGIDVSKKALQVAETWISSEGAKDRVQFMNCSAELLPFRKESFSLIVCSEVIEHCDSPENIIMEISRVLNEKGKAILTVPNLLSYFWMETNVLYRIKRLLGGKRDVETEKHLGFPFWRTLRLLKKSNLVSDQKTSTNIFPLPRPLLIELKRHVHVISFLRRLNKQFCKIAPLKLLGSSLIVIVTKTLPRKL